MTASSLFLVALLAVGCKDKDSAKEPAPAPVETKPAETKAVETKPAETRPAEPPPPVGVIQITTGFTGFSKDGTKFAWLAPGRTAGVRFLKIASVGKDEPELQSVFDDEADSLKKLKASLAGFVPTRTPTPAALKLDGDLTAKPPALRVVGGAAPITVKLGEYPFPPTDAAEIWGQSADGKHIAIHIAGKDVKGTFSSGDGPPFHTFYVVAL
jgi:hypothetical protein